MNSSILKTSVRNLKRNKFFSLLNITGLAMGLAVTILIFNYSFLEFRADKQRTKAEQTYVVLNNNSVHLHYEMAPLLSDQIPGIKYVSMVESGMKNEFILKYKENIPVRSDIIFADSNFIKIFSFGLVSGNLEDALTAPGSIVLTESEARLLFNKEDPIGKILSLRGTYEFLGRSDVEVKAVIKDFPENSNFQFKGAVSQTTAMKMMPLRKKCIWSCMNVQNYVVLEAGIDPEALTLQMNQELRRLIPKKVECNFSLLPYEKAYFSNLQDYFKHGNLKIIYTLGSIAILILLIAVINYINLSIASMVRRQTEVGVRKIFGVKTFQLIIQLLGDSVLISFISMLFAVIFAYLITPPINRITSIHLPEIAVDSASFWLIMVSCSFLIGIVAGLLPAFALNRFSAISLITGRSENQGYGINIKRILIVFQFLVSIILIICTITVTRQLSYLKNSDMGFNSENIVNIKLTPEIKPLVLKERMQRIPGVGTVSFSRWFPGNVQETWSSALVNNGVEKDVEFAAENADANYIDMMGLKIVQGRNFSDSLKSDIGSAIVNEAAVKSFGLAAPLDAYFKQDNKIARIIGVLKDFNFESLHKQIRPLVIFCADQDLFSTNIGLLPGSFNSVSKTMENISSIWNELSPNYPFEYKFLEEQVGNLYRAEVITGKIFRYGSVFAIIISCLGLFGLVLSSTDQRKKEIGIRKVNGASLGEILIMLNKEFVKMVVLAFIIASPFAIFLMKKWLESFAYKVPVSWWIFALAAVIALGVTLLTVTWQSWKAAVRNPVEVLHYE